MLKNGRNDFRDEKPSSEKRLYAHFIYLWGTFVLLAVVMQTDERPIRLPNGQRRLLIAPLFHRRVTAMTLHTVEIYAEKRATTL